MSAERRSTLRGLSRRLHGRRGLKSHREKRNTRERGSPPSRAAWIEICGRYMSQRRFWSPPSRAAWIEISSIFDSFISLRRRRLHGRRGLKYRVYLHMFSPPQSPPSRAAWIEMLAENPGAVDWKSPPSRAAWIEIVQPDSGHGVCGRRLHGRRGLKLPKNERPMRSVWSPLSRGRGLKYRCRRL